MIVFTDVIFVSKVVKTLMIPTLHDYLQHVNKLLFCEFMVY